MKSMKVLEMAKELVELSLVEISDSVFEFRGTFEDRKCWENKLNEIYGNSDGELVRSFIEAYNALLDLDMKLFYYEVDRGEW